MFMRQTGKTANEKPILESSKVVADFWQNICAAYGTESLPGETRPFVTVPEIASNTA